MTNRIPDHLAWKRGLEELDDFRRKEIRESSILRDAPLLQGALESARFLQILKPETGLGKLGQLMAKMKQCST